MRCFIIRRSIRIGEQQKRFGVREYCIYVLRDYIKYKQEMRMNIIRNSHTIAEKTNTVYYYIVVHTQYVWTLSNTNGVPW